MRIIFIIIIITLLKAKGLAQIDSLKTISLDIEIIVHSQDKVKKELKLFFLENKIVPELLSESNHKFSSNFVLSSKSYFTFVKKIEHWGAINYRKIKSTNYTEKLEKINIEIKRLEKEKKEYMELLEKIDIKSESHVRYWEKLEKTKEHLRTKIEKRDEYKGSNKKFIVKLKVLEKNLLSNEPNFSFVNMPGVQYSYFLTSNKEGGVFPKSMNGYSIKYLMNRRKTYLELGLFTSQTDSQKNTFDELYKFGIGQDFYSSHLGRGTRKFFNLYSGFCVGVFILTGNDNSVISWYTTPSIGLEIYKTKNILIDTKLGYFLPFKENRNMKGFLFETSFNIVF